MGGGGGGGGGEVNARTSNKVRFFFKFLSVPVHRRQNLGLTITSTLYEVLFLSYNDTFGILPKNCLSVMLRIYPFQKVKVSALRKLLM